MGFDVYCESWGKKDILNLTCSMMDFHTMFLFIESNILNIRTIPPMCD
jgi:hypothetical protein